MQREFYTMEIHSITRKDREEGQTLNSGMKGIPERKLKAPANKRMCYLERNMKKVLQERSTKSGVVDELGI